MTITPEPPLVSVVIPAYNAEDTIERALDSVAAQAFKNIEVIVVDDTSTDRTAELASQYGNTLLDIKVITLEKNIGVSGARNLGIDAASGTIIAFLDADDEWIENKISIQIDALIKEPSLIFVSCEAILLTSSGRYMSLFNEGRTRPRGADGWKELLCHPSIATPGIVTWRKRLQEIGGFNTSLSTGEDQDLWIKLALLGPVLHIDQILVRVFDTQASLSKREHTGNIPNFLPIIQNHVQVNRSRLTSREARCILGSRLQIVGRDYCRSGQFLKGAKYLSMASIKGFEPIQNFMYLLKNLPPAKWLKNRLSRGTKS